MGRKKVEIIDGMKKCSVCGRMLPLSSFHKNNATISGYASLCKECKKLRVQGYTEKKASSKVATTMPKSFHKIYSNEKLACFTPKQLIDELKARGYRGTLTYQQQIIL